MIVVVGIAVVVLIAVGVVALGVATLGSERGASAAVPGGLIVGAAVVGVLFVLGLAVATLGLDGGARGADAPEAESPTTTVEEDDARVPFEHAIEGAPASYDDFVALDRLNTELLVPRIVPRLADGDLVQVSGRGFVPNQAGVLAQCDGTAGRRCSNLVEVQTDGDGTFRTGYRVASDAAGWALVVNVDGDRRTAMLDLGLERPWPVARIDGDDLVVTNAPVTGLTMARCPRDAVDLDGCSVVDHVSGGPGSTARFGLTSLAGGSPVDVVLVLLDGAGTVLAEPFGFRSDAAPVAAEGPGVSMSPGRLALGLGIAVALLSLAVLLVRRTDWRAPAEAATPGLDDVDLELEEDEEFEGEVEPVELEV